MFTQNSFANVFGTLEYNFSLHPQITPMKSERRWESWSEEEKAVFGLCFERYRKDFGKYEQHIGRTKQQIKSYYYNSVFRKEQMQEESLLTAITRLLEKTV